MRASHSTDTRPNTKLVLELHGEHAHHHALKIVALRDMKDVTNMNETDLDEALAVDVGERGHDELAVHAVGHTAVARDEVVKVLSWVVSTRCAMHSTPAHRKTHLDEEGPLQTAGKEATEGGDEGREERHGQGVEDDGIQHHSGLHT